MDVDGEAGTVWKKMWKISGMFPSSLGLEADFRTNGERLSDGRKNRCYVAQCNYNIVEWQIGFFVFVFCV